ncbi:DUF86 domain-containing protein [Halobacillus locisalis]|uniref:DUF86 domain-containing protein n=1 Tax=Halobacillus locisalis TaxID=220753 RepID=A0A838CVG5_9BACI|nr:DUF86 domain-containing protein [Halobacillus locisalis]MBA2175755.1 DUF86 domain-containing protein [Halobacillus locisalis]
MYFVNREKMEEILNYMETVMDELNKHSYQSFADQLLLERLIHVSIECILDVGNMMIDGFIMRDPGSYDDIIDILTDERVLPEEEQEGYKEFVRLRKSVVQQYTIINHEHLVAVWNKEKSSLKQFPVKVRTYLEQELGPVSAFSRKDE